MSGLFKKLPKGKVVAPTLVNEKTGDIIGPDESKNFRLIGDGILMPVEESQYRMAPFKMSKSIVLTCRVEYTI